MPSADQTPFCFFTGRDLVVGFVLDCPMSFDFPVEIFLLSRVLKGMLWFRMVSCEICSGPKTSLPKKKK